MIFVTLVIAIAIFGSTGPSNAYNFTKEELDAMPSYMRAYYDKTCPKDMEWKHCKDTCAPSCYDLSPTRCSLICLPGCQCKKGLFFSEGKCVSDCSKEKCYGPNEVRSKCAVSRECQNTCFPPKGTRIGNLNFCFLPCRPFECECDKGYIRLHNTWRKDKCVSLATCKKLKDQYGSSLPSNFNISHLVSE